ncbi:MAG: hypothetical protein J0M15_12005 [Deltaproteobacteria bacterium]|jgi:hypothetical protein|nr:hypothetical protein [Deltaproteobacteria bacterium]
MTYSSNFKEMYLTNDPNCSSGGVWESVALTKPWNLSSDSSFKKSVFVKFKDLDNKVTSCSSTSINYVNSQPMAQLYNLPQNGNSDEYLAVEVGGEYLAAYKYKLGTTASIDCSLPSGYSAAGISPKNWIWDSLNSFGNESITLCVIGISSNGVQQAYSAATSHSWTRSAKSYIEVLGSAKSVIEGNQNVQFTLYSKVAPLSPITINYDLFFW